MTNKTKILIEKLVAQHHLAINEYIALIKAQDTETTDYLANIARKIADKVYGKTVFIRGLIEISNICKNNCLYCGIRYGNKACVRYRLTPEEILDCIDEGYILGFRTFVLQGGEDNWFTDDVLCNMLRKIKSRYPDCAVTLSLGERGQTSYEKLRIAGADRYLLRHETADKQHYQQLHPKEMSFAYRMDCLQSLKQLGYQVGCGFMVGSPNQTIEHIAKDLKFIETFKPDMCGIGPFIPHKDTPFGNQSAGTLELTCFLLSIVRIIHPNVLLPATTALGSIDGQGREKGILSGANVVMPNLSPANVRDKYMLYNNKLSSGPEAAQNLQELKQRMAAIGYEVVVARGDVKR